MGERKGSHTILVKRPEGKNTTWKTQALIREKN
jgi:hypothetical protein